MAAFGIPGGRGPDRATKFVLPTRVFADGVAAVTAVPHGKAVVVVGQAVNRATRRLRGAQVRITKAFGKPTKSVVRPVKFVSQVDILKARLKRLTAKSKFTYKYGRPTTKPPVRAVAVVSQVRIFKARLKRLTAKSGFIRVFGQPTAKPKLQPVRVIKAGPGRRRIVAHTRVIKPTAAPPAPPPPVRVKPVRVLRQANSHTARRQSHSGFIKPHGGRIVTLPAPVNAVCAAQKRRSLGHRLKTTSTLGRPHGGVVITAIPVPVNAVCAAQKRRALGHRLKTTSTLSRPHGGVIVPIIPTRRAKRSSRLQPIIDNKVVAQGVRTYSKVNSVVVEVRNINRQVKPVSGVVRVKSVYAHTRTNNCYASVSASVDVGSHHTKATINDIASLLSYSRVRPKGTLTKGTTSRVRVHSSGYVFLTPSTDLTSYGQVEAHGTTSPTALEMVQVLAAIRNLRKKP